MKKRILTVDDSASMRYMVIFSLKEAGYEVIEASGGDEALRKLDNDQLHMIIVDQNMPKMDGITLIREIRARQDYKTVPIIMLSSESNAEIMKKGQEAGATRWIVKPFIPKQLVDVVQKVLR